MMSPIGAALLIVSASVASQEPQRSTTDKGDLRLPGIVATSNENGFREWVGEGAITQAGGRTDLSAFAGSLRRYLERLLPEQNTSQPPEHAPAEPGGCDLEMTAFLDGVQNGPTRTGEDLVAQSRDILIGSVRQVMAGLRYGQPGSLVLVSIISQQKGEWPQRSVVVFVPSGTLRLRGRLVCFSGDAPVPDVGDEVLVFLSLPGPDEARWNPTSAHGVLLFRSQNGSLQGPRQLTDNLRLKAAPVDSSLSALLESLTSGQE